MLGFGGYYSQQTSMKKKKGGRIDSNLKAFEGFEILMYKKGGRKS